MLNGDYEKLKNIRKAVMHMMHYSKSSHIGASLSEIEILFTLYFKVMNIDPENPKLATRDKFILSKAHGSAGLYATMAERGFFLKEYIDQYYIDGGKLPGHLDKELVPGIEISGGSLGHGLPIGIGMALANKIDKNPGKVFVLMGDGECNEGSVWEGAMLAPTLKLYSLTVVIDRNFLQGFGRTEDIIDQHNLGDRWRAFGWDVFEVDGHDVDELEDALKDSSPRLKVVIAKTVKGKGISFMENKLEWHYKSPNDEQYLKGVAEIDGCY